MEWIADAAASVVDLAGLSLGGGDQFRHRSDRQLVGVDEQNDGKPAGERDRREIPFRIVS